MRAFVGILIVVFAIVPALGQLPDFYTEVDSVTWVVKDLDSVIKGWQELGFPAAELLSQGPAQSSFRGEANEFSARVAIGYLGQYRVLWIQPESQGNAFSEFLQKNGEGVFSLNYAVDSPSQLNQEVSRLESLGVDTLQKMTLKSGSGELEFVSLDTVEGGTLALALVRGAIFGTLPQDAAPLGMRAVQYAFVVEKIQPASDYWERLGFPKMQVTHGPLTDLTYRGKPAQFDQYLGWQRHGKIVFEWIESIQGPNVYLEHLAAHGEGFHHLAFMVEDMDKAVAYFDSRGIPCSQSGGWGEKGKSGSGRFAYIDTASIGGVTVELLWNYPD
ncbi:MAG: VOC family protein [Acidobacteriota bacterium]|nr:MAG: VOC family protein [Acidobacteriota bacterium]